ncbi:hypothetical protein M097_0398 [Phocaeicola vulgatus str. 3775 SL(B) 10 (iv)]|uniref:Uncharacterized protein n=1 Tax=Phocaeicola vulgatus str. 3775 SL(B) 10 (iv) TaxID=1339350 RepID=A0A078RCV9_PHOVU|nr:hypothetical protein M097_0398 [Phocaeicola vulgatus str. 3775 SL(B) 10 (iv)]
MFAFGAWAVQEAKLAAAAIATKKLIFFICLKCFNNYNTSINSTSKINVL